MRELTRAGRARRVDRTPAPLLTSGCSSAGLSRTPVVFGSASVREQRHHGEYRCDDQQQPEEAAQRRTAGNGEDDEQNDQNPKQGHVLSLLRSARTSAPVAVSVVV